MKKLVKHMSKKGLSVLQQRFVNNVLKGMNGKAAYIKAGYRARGNGAEVNASKLLRNAKVKAAIAKVRKEASYEVKVSVESALKEEKCIAFSDIGELLKGKTVIPLNELPEHVRRSISSVEIQEGEFGNTYKYKLWDKNRALERIEKHLGMFEKHNQQRTARVEKVTVKFVEADGSNRPVS